MCLSQLLERIKKTNMESDIRFKILKRLQEENKSTGEFKSNCFLKGLSSDLGAIKRALVELLNLGLISESNKDWVSEKKEHVVFKIDTKGPTNSPKKNSERLCSEYGPIRLILTIKGLEFLEQREKRPLEIDSIEKSIRLASATIRDFGEKNKFTKYSLLIAFSALIISSFFNFLTYRDLVTNKSESLELLKQLEKVRTEELKNSNQIEILKNQIYLLGQDSVYSKKIKNAP